MKSGSGPVQERMGISQTGQGGLRMFVPKHVALDVGYRLVCVPITGLGFEHASFKRAFSRVLARIRKVDVFRSCSKFDPVIHCVLATFLERD